MQIRQLQHFVAIINHGSMHAASRAFGLSQPALTRSIQKLERTMNVTLLTREGRSVIPTPAGQVFFQRAKLILNECQSARSEAAMLQSGQIGEVHIGVGPMFTDYIVDTAIARVAKKFPALHVRVTEGYYEDLTEKLQTGSLDLVFLNFTPTRFQSDLKFETLTRVSGAAFVRAGHKLARKKLLTPKDTIDEYWLVIDQPHARVHFTRIFEEAGLPVPANFIATNSLALIKSLVRSGDFITCIPEEMVTKDIASGRLKKLNFPAFTYDRAAGLIHRADQFRTPAMEHLAEAIREAAAEAV